jgi:retron-type reverse transcriptase
MAKKNDGAPGIDGVTFEAIEMQGVEPLLEQLRDELIGRTYQPLPARRQEIPKDGGKVRVLSIPAIRDRVVQGALKLILEPVFEADFQPGSFGYRPKRTAHDAVKRVAEAIVQRKTRVLDFDLRAYFDNVRHDRLLAKVAQRIHAQAQKADGVGDWVEKTIRRHLAHARKRKGFGSERWNRQWLYDTLGLFNAYRVRRDGPKVAPAG